MASFMRRGKKVEELAALPQMDKAGAIQVKTAKKPGHPAPLPPKVTAQLARAEKKAVATGQNPGEMTLYGNESDEHEEVCEDDIIDSDAEVITAPEQMGKKNPGIKPEGGQPLPKSTRPIGQLNDPANMGGEGLEEDGVEDEVEGGVEGVASAIAGGIADGLAGDTIETEPEVDALPGEGIPQDDGDAGINAELGEPVAPPMGGEEGGDGLVAQVAALNARVAELEALLGGSEAGEVPAAEVEIGGEEAGEEGEEDELSIDNAEDEDDEEAGEEGEEEGEEEESGEDSDEEKEEDEAGEEDSEEGDEEDVDGKKLFLGGEEEKK
jgi:hypothetical protein